MKGITLFLCLTSCSVLAVQAADVRDDERRIRESAVVLSEILHAPDQGISRDLIRKAYCVGVVPNLKRAGFVFGAKYGKGVVTCRVAGMGWSAPSTIRIEGGSIGFQIGLGETDLVFAVMNARGMEKLTRDKFTVGGDASAMAGPVGRSTQASTDVLMRAEILSWSRSRGIFAGVSLEGATLRPDNADNDRLYGRPVTQRELLRGHVTATLASRRLFDELNRRVPVKNA
jgi:lipid-binding SYLF domain-containing protein